MRCPLCGGQSPNGEVHLRCYLADRAGFVQLLDEPDEPVGWWGPWVLVLVLAVGSIVLWHLLGAQVWEGGF